MQNCRHCKKTDRPTIVEKRDDPDLPEKAMRLRLRGFSWSQIAKKLNVSRTTARRMYEKGICKENELKSDKYNVNTEVNTTSNLLYSDI